jgi:hypothetical protein
MSEYKVGDSVWLNCYPTWQNQIGFGLIKRIFATDEGVCFEILDEINGGLRLGLSKDVIEKPTGRMISSYAKAKNELNDLRDKDKKKK